VPKYDGLNKRIKRAD